MNKFKVVELKSICKGLGLKKYSKLKKKELIELIENTQNINQEEKKQDEEIEEVSSNDDEDECSICLCEKIDETKINCNHTFCKECIEQWEKNNKSCPLCRKSFTKKIYLIKKNKNIKIDEPYVKVIDMNDYMSEEDFIIYMRNLNLY